MMEMDCLCRSPLPMTLMKSMGRMVPDQDGGPLLNKGLGENRQL